jgi:hypothetical protein
MPELNTNKHFQNYSSNSIIFTCVFPRHSYIVPYYAIQNFKYAQITITKITVLFHTYTKPRLHVGHDFPHFIHRLHILLSHIMSSVVLYGNLIWCPTLCQVLSCIAIKPAVPHYVKCCLVWQSNLVSHIMSSVVLYGNLIWCPTLCQVLSCIAI